MTKEVPQQYRFFLVVLVAVSIAGCKLQIDVSEGGKVTTQSGDYLCDAGETCIIEVDNTSFDEVFSAEPDSGFEFKGWRKRHSSFCGDQTKSCSLSTGNFRDNPDLLALLNSDKSFYLEPVFEEITPRCELNPEEYEWIPREPQIITEAMVEPPATHAELSIRGAYYMGGRHILLVSKGYKYYLAVSENRGRSYRLSDAFPTEDFTISGSGYDFSIAGGVLHIAGHIQWPTTWGDESIEILYFTSDPSFLHFSEPSILSDNSDFYNAGPAQIASAGRKIYIAWNQSGCSLCDGISLEGMGVFMLEFDRLNPTDYSFAKLSPDSVVTGMEIVDGEPWLTWTRRSSLIHFESPEEFDAFRPQVDLYNYRTGETVKVASRGGVPRMHDIGNGKLFVSWNIEPDWPLKNQAFKYAVYDTKMAAFTFRSTDNRRYSERGGVMYFENNGAIVRQINETTDWASDSPSSFIRRSISTDDGVTFTKFPVVGGSGSGGDSLMSVKDINTLFVTEVHVTQTSVDIYSRSTVTGLKMTNTRFDRSPQCKTGN